MPVKKKAKKKSVISKKSSKKAASPYGKSAKKGQKATKNARKKVAKAAAKKRITKPAKKAVSGKSTITERNEHIRKSLIGTRRTILREAREEISKFVKGETKQLVDTALDDGDWSFVDMAEDINLKKLASHKDTLNKIDEALRKINEGTYGLCEDCGIEISEERLRIIPFALYCVECKEQRERREEFDNQPEM